MRRFALPSSVKLFDNVGDGRQKCLTCQSCDPPNWSLDSPIEPTLVLTHLMSNVCVDIFSLPTAKWGGQTFDSMLVCVDRLSGWMLARPCNKVGLTAEKAAHLLLDGGWEVFGIPAVVTCNRGPQFACEWWGSICARLEI